jgi:hypothetical protein
MYKLGKVFFNQIKSTSVIRLLDGACIPFAEDNTDYQAYLKWLDGCELQKTGPVQYEWVKTSNGNTPLPADDTPHPFYE